MPSQKDSRIEDFAYSYLQSYYLKKNKGKNIYVFKAAQTKQGAEVDGLFTFLSTGNQLYTASLNTRCSTKVTGLLNSYKKNGLSKWRYATSILISAIIFFLLFQIINFYIAAIIALSVAIGTFFVHSILENRYKINVLKDIVTKMKNRMPADEKWVGLSMSSLSFRKNMLADVFLKLCEENGLGVITVGQRAKVVLKQEPKQEKCPSGDFLSYYNLESAVRTAVLTNTVLKVA